MEIQTFIGSDIADFSLGERPPKTAEFVGEFDFSSSPAGGGLRQYWLSIENQTATLWDSFIDGDINGGNRLFARVAYCDFEKNIKAVELASSLLLAAFVAEVQLYDSNFSSAKCTEAGLLNGQQLLILINQIIL